MANLTITNNDLGSVILEGGTFQDDLITFAGAGTLLEGTILARNDSTEKLVPFVVGGDPAVNGTPSKILTYELTAAGAGDEVARVGTSGEYVKERLVIEADGDASNVDALVTDALQNFGLVATSVQELNILDNQ